KEKAEEGPLNLNRGEDGGRGVFDEVLQHCRGKRGQLFGWLAEAGFDLVLDQVEEPAEERSVIPSLADRPGGVGGNCGGGTTCWKLRSQLIVAHDRPRLRATPP